MAGARDLPRRLAASVNGSLEATEELPRVQRELIDHLRSVDAGIATLIETMIPIRQDIATLRESVGPDAHGDVAEMTALVGRIEALVVHIDERIPDPDAPSPIEKAKDALLGDS